MSKASLIPAGQPVAGSVSIAALRREPSHRSEQVSQLLFGERATILEEDTLAGWTKIRCVWDGYEGWCKSSQIRVIASRSFKKASVLVAPPSGKLQFGQGAMWLPAGAELADGKRGHFISEYGDGVFKGKKIRVSDAIPNADAVVDAARNFLHAPYEWGGRTVAGIDCSGLVQMAYKLCGMRVLRDASEQAGMGQVVNFLTEARAGDLAFFDNAEGRVVHVGILLGQDSILHATEQSGRVVLDRIDGAGIISITQKRRTHHLRIIKRLIF